MSGVFALQAVMSASWACWLAWRRYKATPASTSGVAVGALSVPMLGNDANDDVVTDAPAPTTNGPRANPLRGTAKAGHGPPA